MTSPLWISVSLWSDGDHLMIRHRWLGSNESVPAGVSVVNCDPVTTRGAVPTKSLSSIISLKLVTPCGPHQRPPRSKHMVPPPLPGLSQNSMADLAFWLEIYNDILACLYTSLEISVEPQDSSVSAGRWAGERKEPPCLVLTCKAKAPVTKASSPPHT